MIAATEAVMVQSQAVKVNAAAIGAGASFPSFNLGRVEWHVSLSHIPARLLSDLTSTAAKDLKINKIFTNKRLCTIADGASKMDTY